VLSGYERGQLGRCDSGQPVWSAATPRDDMDSYTRLTRLLARVLISDPDCWTSGVLARDVTGRPVSSPDDAAT
jgi:hypothetical protein